jgi:hypothetical protein
MTIDQFIEQKRLSRCAVKRLYKLVTEPAGKVINKYWLYCKSEYSAIRVISRIPQPVNYYYPEIRQRVTSLKITP